MDILASRVKKIKPSPTLSISTKAKAMKKEGIDVINFGAGEPDFDTPKNIKDYAIKSINEGFTKYTPVGGIDELKEAIIRKLERENGVVYDKGEIITSCGGKHSLYNIAQAIFEDGDEVIIQSPYWVSYIDIVTLSGATPIVINTYESEGFKIDPSRLKGAITSRTKAIIINNPSNPTGSVYSREELKEFVNLALERNITIISDEIYEKIIYDNFQFVSIPSFGNEVKNITLLVNGVSKSYSMTGWRIGYTAGPKYIISAMEKIQSQSTSNPASISQKASVEALNGPQDMVSFMVKEFDNRRKYIVERLNSMKMVSCYKPVGAFYVFPNFSKYYKKGYKGISIDNSIRFAELLLEEAKVAVVPGAAFGSDDHIRISYATSMDNIKKGLDRIEEFLSNLV